MLTQLHLIGRVAEALVGGGEYRIPIFGAYQSLITLSVTLALTIALARFLHHRSVFIRV